MRSRGRMLVLISTVWAQRTKRTLTRALIVGAQPVEGWWAPVAQHTYKRKRWGSVAQCPKFVALYPPTETLADQGCAEAAGSSTSSPLSPGGHGTARRHPCASRRRPRRRHCYISPCAATSSPFHGGAMAGGNGGHRKVFIYVKKSNLPARSTPRCSKES